MIVSAATNSAAATNIGRWSACAVAIGKLVNRQENVIISAFAVPGRAEARHRDRRRQTTDELHHTGETAGTVDDEQVRRGADWRSANDSRWNEQTVCPRTECDMDSGERRRL